MTAPLDGIKVIDFGQYIAVPGAAALLANLGASVTKVEPIAGEASRHIGPFGLGMIRAYNRGKRGIALDLSLDAGREVARRLVAGSDVLLQNMRPGRMQQLGLGPEAARTLNPRLVYATVTGFGPDGPSRDRAGLDIAAQAESGMMWVTGDVDRDPLRVGFAVVDAATSHALAQAVLAALLHRERTGRGEVVETSLLDVALHLQAPNWSEYFHTGNAPARRGNGQPTVAPAADLVRTADGQFVVSAYTDSHWTKLCKLIGREDLLDDPRFAGNPERVAHRAELLEVLDAAFAHRDTEESVRWLSENGIVVGAVRSYSQARSAPDVQATGIFRVGVDASGADETYVASPYTLGGRRAGSVDPAPDVGEHTEEVLADYGFSSGETAELVAAGVVGSASSRELSEI